MDELRGLARELPKLQAQDELRLLTIETFVHWAGEGKLKSAIRAGNRMRRRYMQQLRRQARGLGKFDAIEGVDILHNSGDLIEWLGAHEISAAG